MHATMQDLLDKLLRTKREIASLQEGLTDTPDDMILKEKLAEMIAEERKLEQGISFCEDFAKHFGASRTKDQPNKPEQ